MQPTDPNTSDAFQTVGSPPCNTGVAVIVVVFTIAAAACSNSSAGTSNTTSGSPSSPSPPATSATAADLAFCVSETNRYRAMVARPALTESAALESYAAAGAQADAASGVPHSHFQNTHGGGVALAENEVLTQPLTILGGSVQSAMRAAMQGFYGEGPGGGHYQNLEGQFTQVGCGVYIGQKLITLVQDFR